MKLEKYCSKQLAKSESLLLFVVLKTNLEPRMIFTFLKACLKKKKRFFYRDYLGPTKPKLFTRWPCTKKKKKFANPSAL